MLVRNALKLCEAERAFIFRFDGRVLRAVASQNVSPEMMEFVRRNPVAPGSHSASARAAHELRTIHIEDIQAEPGYTYGVMHVDPIRTVLAIPLLKAHELLGVIVVYRHEVRQFTVRQIALLETFANQAVIAIENLRLFEEMQAKTRDLTESLEYQTATSDVLSTVARSPSEPQRVLDLIIETAMRLCQAESGNIWKIDDGEAHAIAAHGFDAGFVTYQRSHTIRPGRGNLIGRIMIERRIVHIEDVLADPEYTNAERQKVGRFRTVLGVPMLRDDKLIGVIALAQSSVRPFTDRQIDLLKTFADQAVIAIENTRLFEAEQASKRELQESLEYQTATAEVLSVISRSPNALQPVLDSIVETAQRLCQSDRAQFFKLENGKYHLASQQGTNPDFLTYLVDNPISVDPQSGSATNTAVRPATSTAVRERRTVHVPDVLADPGLAGAAHLGRARSVLAVPLVRNRVVIGVVIVAQDTVRPFTGRQIELIETFASQALIAIENTRLFEAEQASKRELTEALEQQTATADVLKVISRSALDLQRVLDALVESAARLCDAPDAAIFQVFGDSLRLVADYRQTFPMAGAVGQLTLSLVRGRIVGRAVIDRRTIQVADALAEADEYPESWKIAQQYGHRTMLAVPLVHAGEAIGVIYIRRAEVHPFTERQIELVNTFADQAVIAIENTRLFEEVQARTRELAKTVEDLEIASQHKNQFVANMSHELRTPLAAILGYAELIQEGFYEPQGPKSLIALTRIRSNGKHLLGLINTVLDIAKIESGQFTLNMSEYAIESVVETVRAATESLAQNKKLTLTTSVDKSLPVGLGDEQRLTQVLLNLVGNAIKFTDVGEVGIAAGARNGHFAVSVTDTGPGIPLDQQDRIFEQFHQIDSSNTKAKGGTGLGLAIAKQIVEMHGGRIWVESTLGKGSSFQMEVPIRAEYRKGAP
jgi:signal transduction histidine kinase